MVIRSSVEGVQNFFDVCSFTVPFPSIWHQHLQRLFEAPGNVAFIEIHYVTRDPIFRQQTAVTAVTTHLRCHQWGTTHHGPATPPTASTTTIQHSAASVESAGQPPSPLSRPVTHTVEGNLYSNPIASHPTYPNIPPEVAPPSKNGDHP